jgi:hypothetical protein
MSWEVELVQILRVIINDLDSPPTYTDARLKTIIVVAARYVVQEIDIFPNTYTISVTAETISPDPTDAATRDDAFIDLVVLKAGCFIDHNTLRAKALIAGVKAVLGPATLDVGGGKDGFLGGLLAVLENGPCAMYEDLKRDYCIGNIPVRAILSPFVHNQFDPRVLAANNYRGSTNLGGIDNDSFF